jgi:hypothetical protein
LQLEQSVKTFLGKGHAASTSGARQKPFLVAPEGMKRARLVGITFRQIESLPVHLENIEPTSANMRTNQNVRDGGLLTLDKSLLRRRAEKAANRLDQVYAGSCASTAIIGRLVGAFCVARDSSGRAIPRKLSLASEGFRDVSLSKDTDPKRQIDLNNAANEVPFLVTASELQDRKVKRRRGSKAEKRPTFFQSFQRHFPPE